MAPRAINHVARRKPLELRLLYPVMTGPKNPKLPIPGTQSSAASKSKSSRPDPPDLLRRSPGPNPVGYCPKPWGLLDFQDVAIFIWPDLREFEIEERCLILGHRNPRLKDITPEELIEVEQWMSRPDTVTDAKGRKKEIGSHTIDAEGGKVDIRGWRKCLKHKELIKLVKRMEEDLERATRLKVDREQAMRMNKCRDLTKKIDEEMVIPSPARRKRKGVIEDSSDDE